MAKPPDRILDFAARFGNADLRAHVNTFLAAQQRNNLQPKGLALGDPGLLYGPPVRAEIRADDLGGQFGVAGRWCAFCDACGGGEYVLISDPKFMCTSCFNRAHEHRWRTIELPDEATRAEIERVLLLREPKWRNWDPAETVFDLQKQNLHLGVGV